MGGKGSGGKRVRAGRKPLGPLALVRITVRLVQADIDYLRELGNDNLSAGVREAILLAKQQRSE